MTSGRTWPLDALPYGTPLFGYEIDGLLGRGGFGITYRARDKLDQVFAIKECFPRQFAVRQQSRVQPTDSIDSEPFADCKARFTREAKALVQLSRIGAASEGVVKVHTFFEANDTAYIVMEYLEGRSLETLLAAHPGGVPADMLADLVPRLLHAIGCVHDAGLLHRDIKPANIILREDERPVLIDFGAARGAGSGDTRTFTQIYSEGYAPIEQFSGAQQGAYSDIYAVGMTFYRAIGGRSVDAFTRQQAQLRGKPDPLVPAARAGAGRYAPALLACIDSAVSVSPDDRPQSVGALMAGLDDSSDTTRRPSPLRHAGRDAPPVPFPAPAASPVLPFPASVAAQSSRRWGPRAGLAVAVLLLGATAWANLTFLNRSAPGDTAPVTRRPAVAPAEQPRQPLPAPSAAERDTAQDQALRDTIKTCRQTAGLLRRRYVTLLTGLSLDPSFAFATPDDLATRVDMAFEAGHLTEARADCDALPDALRRSVSAALQTAAAGKLYSANQKIDAGKTADADLLLKQVRLLNKAKNAL